MSSLKAANILVFGATGVIGQFIIAELIASKASFKRIAIFTSPSTIEKKSAEIQKLRDAGVEILSGNVNNDADVLAAYDGFDTVICAFGRNVITKQIDLIRLAETSNDVKWFFPSEFGTDIEYSSESKDEPPHQQKLKVRAYIKEHVKRLSHTYVVTGPYPELFVGSFHDPKAVTFDVARCTATVVGTGKEKIGFTTMSDVGRFVVAALKHPEVARNRALKVQSFVTTLNEIVAEFETQTGNKWQVDYVPFAQLQEREQKQWHAHDPSAPIYTLRRIWIGGGTLYDHVDNKQLGIEQTDSLAKVIQDQIKTGGGQAIRSGELQ